MSRTNVEVMRTWIEAWNRGDIDQMLSPFAPEVEWRTSGFPRARPGLYRSRWVQEFWREFVETWESFQISTEEVRDCRPRSSRDTGRAMSRENLELVRALQPDPDVNLVDLFGDQETWDSLVKATAPSSTSLGRSGCQRRRAHTLRGPVRAAPGVA
jgi:ketosteroid isomerase-like protein